MMFSKASIVMLSLLISNAESQSSITDITTNDGPKPPPPVPSGEKSFENGISTGVSEDTILADGWTRCYTGTYGGESNVNINDDFVRNCDGEKIMYGCRPNNEEDFRLIGYGDTSKAFTVDLDDLGTIDGAIKWYFSDNRSLGFAEASDELNLNSCDFLNFGNRLCWHTLSGTFASFGGYRCGDELPLNGRTDWDKVAWTKGLSTNPPTNPPTNRPTNPPTKLPTSSPTNPPTELPTSSPTNPPTSCEVTLEGLEDACNSESTNILIAESGIEYECSIINNYPDVDCNAPIAGNAAEVCPFYCAGACGGF